MEIIYCPHCAKEIDINSKFCNECGKAINKGISIPESGSSTIFQNSINTMQNNIEPFFANKTSTKSWLSIKRNKITVICVAVAIVLIAILTPIIVSNTLSGNDKIVYDLILEASHDFKDPSSVRIISGSLSVDKDGGWFILSAKNSYGARDTGNYFIGYIDGEVFVLEQDTATYLHRKTSEFNIDKVNNALEKYWKNFS
jgi:hypothetical protein